VSFSFGWVSLKVCVRGGCLPSAGEDVKTLMNPRPSEGDTGSRCTQLRATGGLPRAVPRQMTAWVTGSSHQMSHPPCPHLRDGGGELLGGLQPGEGLRQRRHLLGDLGLRLQLLGSFLGGGVGGLGLGVGVGWGGEKGLGVE